MAKKKRDLDELIEQALDNAIEDRKKAKDLAEKLEPIFDINPRNVSELDGAMLVGSHLIKLLEQTSRANDQIVKLAQIKEKEESREPKNKDERTPIDLSALKRQLDEAESEEVEVPVEPVKARVSDEQ